MFYKVEGHKNLIKDSHSKAVINTDTSAMRRHQVMFENLEKERNREEELQRLRSDVNEIKDMLRMLLEKR